MADSIRNAIQQYGAIVESLVHAFLSFAPVAAGVNDVETEKGIQLMQSISDVVSLRRDKYLQSNASRADAIRFVLRIIRCFQLWAEMNSRTPRAFAMKLELVKVALSSFIIRSRKNGRLSDTEAFEMDTITSPTSTIPDYIGSRSGTRLPVLTSLIPPKMSETQLSDFLHMLVPLVYLTASGDKGWRRAPWTAWFLAIALESASIAALPHECQVEKSFRKKKLFMDSVLRQPMFGTLVARPASAVSRVWGMIPLLRDINYLEYYLQMHVKYFYFLQQ
jgi:hypothetical protein